MADWTMATAVGTGEKGFGGDGGPAGAALLNGPFDIAFDFLGNMYFSDTFNNRIRRVEAATIRSYFQITHPWSYFLEDTIIDARLQEQGEHGDKIFAMSNRLGELVILFLKKI
jgi:hypothetical protein